ncbi:MAG: hypothetical protein CXT69_06545 [Methanobacteriota archaeon]|nr:MAG: hypothetical protein CXT69_06545 [Euryarchaeota archaeon]HIK79008.1 hypothetical protein [Candidatus Poseidoniales archaeon]
MSDSNTKPIIIADKAWSERQFIEHILARYFTLTEDLGGINPAWSVLPLEGVEDGDPHIALELANSDLAEIDMCAELFDDEPWAIQITPTSIGLFSMSKKTIMLFWIASFFSTFLVSSNWIESTIGGNFTDKSVLTSALFFYAIPFTGTLALASYLQVSIGKKLGVRLGHILPIPMPLPYFPWPFGIIYAPSSPSMDRIIWPNRRSLALSAIVAPSVLIISGFFCIMLGLWLTPENVTLSQQPNRLSFPLIANLIGSVAFGSESLYLLGAWAHPLALAGLGLMMLGWIYLLPIPGFPGSRILISFVGLEAARSFRWQVTLFLMVAVTGLMFGALDGHSLWSFLTIYGSLQILLFGSNLRTPRILDDLKPLNEKTGTRLSHFLFVALLLALPSEMPTEMVSDWDATPEWSIPTNLDLDLNSTGKFYILLDSSALLTQDWSVRGWTNDTYWDLKWQCTSTSNQTLNNGCSGQIQPLSKVKIPLMWASPTDSKMNSSVVEIHLWLQSGSSSSQQTIRIIPNSHVVLASTNWNWNQNHESPQLCTSILFAEDALPGNVSIIDTAATNTTGDSSLLWALDGLSSAALIPNELENHTLPLCLNGESGAIHQLSGGLSLRWVSDEGEIYTFTPSVVDSVVTLSTSGQPTMLLSDIEAFTSNSYVLWNAEYTFCREDLFPRLPGVAFENGSDGGPEWRWDLLFREYGIIPNLANGSLNLTVPAEGWLMICDEDSPLPSQYWQISATSDEYSLSMINGQLLNSIITSDSSTEFSLDGVLSFADVELRTHGNVDFDVVFNQSNYSITINQQNGQIVSTSAWLQLDSDGLIELHVASWEIGV